MGASPQTSRGTTGALFYAVEDDGYYDEAFEATGVPRAAYGHVLGMLSGTDLAELATSVAAGVEQLGASFGSGASAEPFHLDPIPRVLNGAEWSRIESGLGQRVRALSAFAADVYGERAIVAAGVVPERALETSQ